MHLEFIKNPVSASLQPGTVGNGKPKQSTTLLTQCENVQTPYTGTIILLKLSNNISQSVSDSSRNEMTESMSCPTNSTSCTGRLICAVNMGGLGVVSGDLAVSTTKIVPVNKKVVLRCFVCWSSFGLAEADQRVLSSDRAWLNIGTKGAP